MAIDSTTAAPAVVGNLRTTADPQASYLIEYGALNRLDLLTIDYLTAESGFPTITLDYEYDAQGNMRLVQDNLGAQVESVHDDRNLLESRLWSGADVDDARIDFRY